MDKRNRLDYTLDALRDSEIWTLKELEAEYKSLYEEAQSRLAELSESEWADSEWYRYGVHSAKPSPEELELLYQGKDYRNNLELSLYETYQFLNRKTSTVEGLNRMRQKAVKSLNISGYDFVTEKNWRAFAEFISEYKSISAEHFKYRATDATAAFGAATDLSEQVQESPAEVAHKFLSFLESNAGKKGRNKRKTSYRQFADDLIKYQEKYLK